MEGKAVLVFLGFVSCVFAVYPMKKKCDQQCFSDRNCEPGYYCKTVGCNSMCRPVEALLPVDRVSIDSIIPGNTLSSGCLRSCRLQGRQDCRRFCQRMVDNSPLDHILPGGSVDRIISGGRVDSIIRGGSVDRIIPGGSVHDIIPGGSVDRIIRGDSVDRIIPGGSVRRIIPSGSVDRILPGGSVDAIHPKGCVDRCFSRNQCNFNEDCQNRNGCNECVRVKNYT